MPDIAERSTEIGVAQSTAAAAQISGSFPAVLMQINSSEMGRSNRMSAYGPKLTSR
jgi:hypothetical protein